MDSSTDPTAFLTRRRCSALVTSLLVLVALGFATGSAAAHNPACHQVAGPDGPHYDNDRTTGSPTAYSHNPNLMGVDRPNSNHPDHANSIHNREGGCSVGNSGDDGNDKHNGWDNGNGKHNGNGGNSGNGNGGNNGNGNGHR